MKIKIPVSEAEIKNELSKQGFLDNQVLQALSQAKESHKAHKTSGDEPFLEHHLYPVVYTLLNTIKEVKAENRTEAVAIAFLHDVIEDDPAVDAVKLSDTFPNSVVEGVGFLTRQPEYQTASDEKKLELARPYMKRLMTAPQHVRMVKLADRAVNLALNLSIAKIDRPTRTRRLITDTATLFMPLADSTSKTYRNVFEIYLHKLKHLDKA